MAPSGDQFFASARATSTSQARSYCWMARAFASSVRAVRRVRPAIVIIVEASRETFSTALLPGRARKGKDSA